jgi:hypothetical protein
VIAASTIRGQQTVVDDLVDPVLARMEANGGGKAVTNLRTAFREAEKECPGIIQKLLTEVIERLEQA